MKEIKNKKINKKGIVENFLALLFVIIGLAVVFGLLFFVMSAKMKTMEKIVSSDINIKEGLYTTRILLEQEVRPGYKVYELVIDTVNKEDYATFEKDLSEVIHKFYPAGQMNEEWRVIINDRCFIFGQAGGQSSGITVTTTPGSSSYVPLATHIVNTCSKNEINVMPRVTVPNPNGENILVLFKPADKMDSQAVRIFGSRADQMNGVGTEEVPVYANDGRALTRMDDIPGITCDESATIVGKICVADEDLVDQLCQISVDELAPKNWRIEITQAYRTYDIQKKLYDENCKSGTCKPPTCNPDKVLLCPHMQAGAIDIMLFDENGKNINDYSPKTVEDLMCKYGFVRWHEERWHFEYGTNKWEEIKEKEQETGKRICSY